MRGLKRKIPIKKIEDKDARAVAFSKRSQGLYSKTAKYCHLSDSQAAIITTPPSANSYVSYYSFGHSSVDSVVAAFLAGQRPPPPEDQGLGCWWEDEGLAKSEDLEELRNARDAMTMMLHNLRMFLNTRGDREDVKKKKKKKKDVSHGTLQNEPMNLQPSSSANENYEGLNKNTEEQFLAILDKSSNDELEDKNGKLDEYVEKLEGVLMNVEMDEMNQNPFSDSEAVKGGELVVHGDFYENSFHLDDDQFLAISDNKNNSKNDVLSGNFGELNQEMDLDKMIDFDTNCDTLSTNLEKMDGDAVEDERSEIHKDSQ